MICICSYQLHLMTCTINNVSAKISFTGKILWNKCVRGEIALKPNQPTQANHNDTECNLLGVARGAELAGFFTLPSCGSTFGSVGNREAGRKFLSYGFCLSSYFVCPGNSHLFTFPVQGINFVRVSAIFPFTVDGEHFHWSANSE